MASSSSTANRDSKIVKQLEFYFGDTNSPYDEFMQVPIKLDDGWVPISVLLTFRMLKSITGDPATIASAVRQAAVHGTISEVDDTGKKIRRKPKVAAPTPDNHLFEDIAGRTMIYCSGFPKTATMDELLVFAEAQGENAIKETTPMRSSTQAFVGSVYFTFSTRNEAEKFMARVSVKFNGEKIERMWPSDFSHIFPSLSKRETHLLMNMMSGYTRYQH